MAIDGADGIAILVAALAVPVILISSRSFRAARSHAGRAVAVAMGIFGVTLLALVVPLLVARLLGATATIIWKWLDSS